MSQMERANRLGVSFQQVQKYEKGESRVGAGRLEQIAEALGVTPAFFFNGASDRVSKADAEAIDSGIGLLRRQGALRVLKAYDAVSSWRSARSFLETDSRSERRGLVALLRAEVRVSVLSWGGTDTNIRKGAPMHNPWIVTAVALVAGFALPAHAQQKIGKATSVKPQAQGSVAGQLAPNSDVHARETVSTSTGGQAELQFLDNTKLSVGPMSTVRLDKFAYDPNKGNGAVVVNASRGAYRFITGVQDPRSYEIKTPYATLGVRGTVLEVVIEKPARAGHRHPATRTVARR